MKKEIVYDKLIRDKIPEIMKKNKQEFEIFIASKAHFIKSHSQTQAHNQANQIAAQAQTEAKTDKVVKSNILNETISA